MTPPTADTDEAVIVTNTGNTPASLTGLFLTSINGANGSVILSIDLTSVGSLPAGGSVIVAQDPMSFEVDVNVTVIAAGASSFLQNGDTAGDGVMLVDTTGATAVVVDSFAWGGACKAEAVTVGGKIVSADLVEGNGSSLVDAADPALGLCRRHDGSASQPFALAMDSGDGAADWFPCSF